MKIKYVFALLAVAIVAASTNAANIEEYQKTIKTYPFSSPDPVPILIRSSMWGRSSRLYPYSFFSGYSREGIQKDWKIVEMENPYIKAFVMPQLGGKLAGAIEKSTGKEFIYLNNVIKFREIALRGPWTSGGIEANFGVIGHSPTCSAPVDYITKKNKDGSVSCTIGTMDLPSRTRWSVTITVPKDKACLETKTFWLNPSPFNQSYYCWMNAAVEARDDLEFIYPGTDNIYGNSLRKWPIDEKGRNLSLYKNHSFGPDKDYFVVGEYADFYGGYWHDLKLGYGHWARYDDMPGKKVFLWSPARSGAIWEDLLTDTDGQYCEPQAGRHFHQHHHDFFAPGTADTWQEMWFPYKDIGPMSAASSFGALNVTKENDSIKIGVCAFEKIDEVVTVKIDGKKIYKKKISLDPMQTWQKTIAKIPFQANLTINVGDKISYTNDKEKFVLDRPFIPEAIDESTAEGLYQAAIRCEKDRSLYPALIKYQACLTKEPYHIGALNRSAELYCRNGQYEKALENIQKSLSHDIYNAQANFIYGVICRRTNKPVNAKEAFGWAARSMQYRSAAYCQMSEMFLAEENFRLAIEYADRAMDFNKYNVKAMQAKVITYRKTGENKKAENVLAEIENIDPLNHFIRSERFLAQPTTKNLSEFQSLIRNEFVHETYLELSIYYASMGLQNDAVNILKNSPQHPVVYYWLAWLLKDTEPLASHKFLTKAEHMSAELVFPFREESIPVFNWAIKNSIGNWKAKYYLGLIYWSKGLIEESQQIFNECGEPDYAPFYISRAYLWRDNDANKALVDFEKALQIDPNNWRNWDHLIQLCNKMEMYEKALNFSKQAFEKFSDAIVIKLNLTEALVSTGHYAEALEILETISTLPYEGAHATHDAFVYSHIRLALKDVKAKQYDSAIGHLEKSKEFPENLGTGEPYNPDFRRQDYLAALCYEKMGLSEKAKQMKKQIYDYTTAHGDQAYWGSYYAARVMREMGKEKQAIEMLDSWCRNFENRWQPNWYRAKFLGDTETLKKITEKYKSNASLQETIEMIDIIDSLQTKQKEEQ